MVGKYKAYPEYKDSGVEWLGYIPEHWKINKLGYIGEMRNGLTYSPDDITNDGQGILVLRSSNIQNGKLCFDDNVYVNKKIPEKLYTKENDILICSRNGSRNLIGKNALIPYEYEKYSYGAFMLIYRSSYNLYLSWVFNSILFIHQSSSFLTTTINQLTVDNLKNFEIPIPSVKEQKEIINFLTYETFKIDTLIEKQQQLIKLLEEKRQAVISYAVTNGLNPNVPMRDSGVEWLGEIPEHWQIWKLAHAFEIIGSGTTPPSDTNDWYGDDINWVTTGELREDIILSTSKKIKKKTLQYFSTLKIYPKGTILIAMYGATIGRLGILGESATTNQACCALSNSNYLFNMYLFYWLISFRQEIIQLSSGGGQPNINQEKVAALKISTPTLEEQKEIISFLDQETLKLRHLIAKANKVIELLKERRTALISAAVTGKIDVRDWQAPTVMD